MANLQLKHLSKMYPSGELALYKIALELKSGEFVAVVGGEKSGKTTLLRVIAGLEEATDGEIIIGDKNVADVPSRDRDVAMIFQGNTLYPTLTVFENMAYGLKVRKTASAVVEQRVKAAAEILGLTDVLYRKPKTLTAEQRQTAAFGRAIVREPKLYLLDDPIAGVAPDVRERLRSVLINLQIRMNGTFVYASKNVNEALTMASRMVVLREGFVQQIDTPANLYDYPANAFVAFTIGSPTVNFVNNAKIERDENGTYAAFGNVKLALPENIVSRFTAIDEYAGTGKQVILGIRPEDMGVADDGFAEATVAHVEAVAGVNYAECDVNKQSFVVAAGAACEDKKSGIAKGGKVKISADLTHAFLFDAETRLTLLERDGGYKQTDCADAEFKPLSYTEEQELKKKFTLPSDKKKK